MALSEEQPEKHCWVCFSTERDDLRAEWVSPCRCKGCTKWIHQSCLQRWLDEKQKSNSGGAVSCPQCGTQYHIVFPSMGPLAGALQQLDAAVARLCPLAAAGVAVGGAYWSAVSFGAVTVMQVFGHQRGLLLLERADPLLLLLGLPTIPALLVLGRTLRWEEAAARLWQRHRGAPPADGRFPPRFPGDHLSVSRTLCGALLLPSAASLLGKTLFRRVSCSLQRTLLGGLAFVLIKGVLKVYFRQQQLVLQARRLILDYPEGRGHGEGRGLGEGRGHGDQDSGEDSGSE